MSCPFCSLPQERIVAANTAGFVVRDAYPASPGHTLIISRRHVGSFFELNDEERTGMLSLLDQAKAELQASHGPQSYNIGINDEPAAGQKVPQKWLRKSEQVR